MNKGSCLIPVLFIGGALMLLALPVASALAAIAEGDPSGWLIVPFLGVLVILGVILLLKHLPDPLDISIARNSEVAEAEHQARLREIEQG